MRRRFPFGLTIVCVVAVGLLIGLGSLAGAAAAVEDRD